MEANDTKTAPKVTVSKESVAKATGSEKGKPVYNKGDSVKDMEKSTISLFANSSRQVLQKAQEEEDRRLKEMMERTYSPRVHQDKVSEMDLVRGSLNLV